MPDPSPQQQIVVFLEVQKLQKLAPTRDIALSRTFSKVSALVHLLYEGTIQRTFQNFQNAYLGLCLFPTPAVPQKWLGLCGGAKELEFVVEVHVRIKSFERQPQHVERQVPRDTGSRDRRPTSHHHIVCVTSSHMRQVPRDTGSRDRRPLAHILKSQCPSACTI